MNYKICPQCEAEHRQHIKTCGCGYTWKTSQSTTDGIQRCCVCGNQGVWSDSVRGGGSWYCREHSSALGQSWRESEAYASRMPKTDEQMNREARDFLKSRGWEGENLRERCLAMVRHPKDGGNKIWALKVLEREQQGEKLLIIQRQMAREALGFATSIDCGEALARFFGESG